MRKLRGIAVISGAMATLGLMAHAELIEFPQARARSVAFRGGGSINIPGDVHATTPFSLLDAPAAASGMAPTRNVSLAGGELFTFGPGLVVTDGDRGDVVLADEKGREIDRIHIGAKIGQIAVDHRKRRIYVADRNGDRIVVVDGRVGLQKIGTVKTPREPYGLALTPQGDALLVTTVADQQLVAVNTATKSIAWKKKIGKEARGVAVSPSGKKAMVTYLTTSAVANIDLKTRSISYAPIGRLASVASIEPVASRKSKRARFSNPSHETINTFARNAYAAQFLKEDLAIVAFQRSTPVQRTDGREVRGSYGGGGRSAPPVVHRLAFLQNGSQKSRAHVNAHIPRAVTYDPDKDMLYLAGKGNDAIFALADATKPSVHLAWKMFVNHHAVGRERCGPTGLAVGKDGTVYAKCELSRSVAMVTRPQSATVSQKAKSRTVAKIAFAKTLGKSSLSKEVMAGRELFFTGGDRRLSGQGAMACASCHAEGRTDGLSWRIEGHTLQTPLLAGRLVGTHPYKWDGKDPNLTASLTNTVRRLGGSGLTPKNIKDLRAFVEYLEPPRAPTPKSVAAVHRGKALFASKELGCKTCHSGAKMADNQNYDLAADLDQVDTPSLIGLAHTAPYYHDGSAATLRALVMENGSVHGMGRMASLKDPQIDDLVAYLETL